MERLRGQAQTAALHTTRSLQEKAPQYLEQGRAMATGGKIFGRSFWKQLAHAGRMLWHEVTGVFFALFALFFSRGAWQTRLSWRRGAEHQHFLLYLALAALFAYFTVSAFWRSRHLPR